MCWVLLVASASQGRPRLSALNDVIRRARALREYDRHGLLVVTEGPDGMTLDIPPDAADQISKIAQTTRADN